MQADRVKNLFLFIVLLGWGATVSTTIAQGKIPDAPLLGIPGMLWLALNPPRIGRGTDEPATPPPVDPPPPAPAGGTGAAP